MRHAPARPAVLMTRQRLIYRRLAIDRLFHSRWIDSAREPFHRTLGRIPMHSSSIPVVCCSRQGQQVDAPPATLWRAVRQPI